MASILVRRDQFNITPHGIVHKPTDSHFTPHPGDPFSGRIHLGQLGVVPLGERYDPDQVKKMMMELWAEYVTANPNMFLSEHSAERVPLNSRQRNRPDAGNEIIGWRGND